MPQTTTLTNRGLYTFPDLLGEIPQGALTQADNIVIDRDGVVTPRRGFATYGAAFGTSGDVAKQLLYYKARLLRHWDTNLDFDSDGQGTFVNLASNIIEQSSGVKIKFAEMNGNLYFTSSKGIKKISATSADNVVSNGITFAGGIEALDGEGYLNPTQGWFTQDSQVAYRIVWGIKDSNSNVVLGNPSERIVVTNSQLSLTVSDFNKLLIALDLVASAAPTVLTGNTNGTTTLSGLSSTANLSVGMTVTDTTNPSNIPANTVISSILNSTSITISNAATGTHTGDSFSFGQVLSYTNFSSLELPSSASSTELYSALQALAAQLDTSLNEHIYNGLSGTITSIIPSVNVTTTANANYTDVLTNVISTQNIVPGMTVSGEGVSTGTTVVTVSPTAPIVTSGTVTSASTLITSISNMAGISLGMTVTGDGIPAGSTVQILPTTLTGNTTASSTTISGLSSTSALTVGMPVYDNTNPSNIATGTIIASIVNSTSITVSVAPTGTHTADSLSFGVPQNSIAISQDAVASNSAVTLSFTNNTITVSSVVENTSPNVSFTFSSPTIITSASHDLTTGDEITITGSNSNPIIDTTTPVVVTVLNANQFSIPTQTTLSGNAGTWQQYPASVALTYAPNLTSLTNPATTTQLTYLQNFYDGLVNNLNIDENISANAKKAIGGEFSNSTQSATTNIVFTIPSQVTTAWFYQVYRSDMATSIGQGLLSDQTADDECKLIDEDNPSAQDIANGYINFFDDVPESYRVSGANLYTNAISGAGILQENSIPPYAQDICLWTNFLFFANTSEKHELQINLLTTTNLTGNTFTTTWNGISTTYTFVPEVAQYTTITTPAGSAFPSSGAANYFDIYNAQNYTTYRFWFNVGTATAPSATGVTLIPVAVLSTDTANQVAAKLQYAFLNAQQDFSTLASGSTLTIQNNNTGYTNSPVNHVTASGFVINVSVPGSGERASTQSVGVSSAATPAQQIDETARSLVRIVNHNSQGGIQATYLSGPTSLPGEILFEVIETSLIPIYFTASSAIGATNFDPALPVSGESVVSDNSAFPNRLYWSKTQEPDAVPQVNYQDIGQLDYPILRILPLRDSLFILKEDGIYRLYGNDPSNFTVYLFDSSTKLLAQETAVVLNNQIYMFTNQGVVTASDTGVSIISRPIENNIVPINVYPNFTSTSFGVSYEADRAYLLWCQASSTDTQPTICYRYNTLTTTWVDWPITKVCGVVIPDTNILYLGPGDVNYIEKERKSYTRFDQADRQYDQTIPVGGVNGATLSLGSIFQAAEGDAIVQTQYLTLADYNRMIYKLDSDPGTDEDYASYLASPGVDLRSQLTSLASALDADPNLHGGYSAAISGFGTSFLNQQQAFNAIVNLLNLDSGARYHNYTQSTGTLGFEVLVTATNSSKSTITTSYSAPFIAGTMTIYKAISSNLQWAPQHCGDPSMLKKFYEGTLMFQNMSFDTATLSYSSDLYTGLTAVPFTGEGADTWGGVNWGSTTWGGDGTSRPLRTYIPVPNQRCRFIQPTFDHSNALRTYSIFGVSYTWEPISSRGYR